MAALTIGTLGTAAVFIYPYWRIPVRWFQWWRAEEADLAVGQVWRECGFGKTNKDWKVSELDEDLVTFLSVDREDDFGDAYELNLDLAEWSKYAKRLRMFCLDRNDSVEDSYWGDAAE